MNIHGGLKLVAIAAVLVTAAPAVWADRGHEGHGNWRHESRGQVHGDDFARRDGHGRHDQRHGAQTHRPRSHWIVPRAGISYYFSAGPWYRPLQPHLVVKPRVGAVVPVVPLYAITVWSGGITYYFADGIYYVWSPHHHGYRVSVSPFGR